MKDRRGAQRRRLGRPLALLLMGALLTAVVTLPPAPAGASEMRDLEVVGVVPLDAASRRRGVFKNRAIAEALWEGVSRVATELVMEEGVRSAGSDVDDARTDAPDAGDDDAHSDTAPADGASRVSDPVRAALGDDMGLYTRNYRILEDQGERPALFGDAPDVQTEYVVVVAVQVDVERVRARLREAGLIASLSSNGMHPIRLEIRGLTRYQAYAELLEVIRGDRMGVEAVRPLEFERGRQVLWVQSEWGAADLLDRILARARPGMRITPLAVDDRGPRIYSTWRSVGSGRGSDPEVLVLNVEWSPEPAAPGKTDTRGAKDS